MCLGYVCMCACELKNWWQGTCLIQGSCMHMTVCGFDLASYVHMHASLMFLALLTHFSGSSGYCSYLSWCWIHVLLQHVLVRIVWTSSVDPQPHSQIIQ